MYHNCFSIITTSTFFTWALYNHAKLLAISCFFNILSLYKYENGEPGHSSIYLEKEGKMAKPL